MTVLVGSVAVRVAAKVDVPGSIIERVGYFGLRLAVYPEDNTSPRFPPSVSEFDGDLGLSNPSTAPQGRQTDLALLIKGLYISSSN